MEKELYVVIETPTRSKNIGPALRCAVAFGATSICIYGHTTFSTHGAHGAQKHIPVIHFYYLNDCVDFLKSRRCKIYGIASKSTTAAASLPVECFEFSKDGGAAFLLASGRDTDCSLSPEQIGFSDAVLHCTVPVVQLETLLHYNAKLSICLQAFAIHAGFPAVQFSGEKHVINSNILPARQEVIDSYKLFIAQTAGSTEAGHCYDEVGDLQDNALSNLFM